MFVAYFQGGPSCSSKKELGGIAPHTVTVGKKTENQLLLTDAQQKCTTQWDYDPALPLTKVVVLYSGVTFFHSEWFFGAPGVAPQDYRDACEHYRGGGVAMMPSVDENAMAKMNPELRRV